MEDKGGGARSPTEALHSARKWSNGLLFLSMFTIGFSIYPIAKYSRGYFTGLVLAAGIFLAFASVVMTCARPPAPVTFKVVCGVSALAATLFITGGLLIGVFVVPADVMLMFMANACERFGRREQDCDFHWTVTGISLIVEVILGLVGGAGSSYLAWFAYEARDAPAEKGPNEITALAPKLTRVPHTAYNIEISAPDLPAASQKHPSSWV